MSQEQDSNKIVLPTRGDIERFGRPEGSSSVDRLFSVMVANTATPEGRAVMKGALGIEPKPYK